MNTKRCTGCGEYLKAKGYSEYCYDCHEANGLAYDECGCEHCQDKLESRADALYDQWKDGEL